MKRCKNCWTDNPDSAERCQKCGRSLDETWWKNKKFRLYPRAVIGSLLVGVILLIIGYYLTGFNNILFWGLFLIPFVSGCLTTILAYRMEADTSNSLLNSLATGIILGFSTVIIMIILSHSVTTRIEPIILILIPFIALLTFVGGKLGTVINIAVENGKKPTIIIAMIILSVIALGGYGIYQFELYASYENGAYGLSYDLDYLDIVQSDADNYLNASYNTSHQRLSNLKNAKIKYERMVNITNGAKPQSGEMIGNSSSSIKQEYADAMGVYLQLKHNYCTEMYQGIQLDINGNIKEAQKHYKTAKSLIPQIQSQNDQITMIIGKDPSFQQYITGTRDKAKKYVGMHKEENMTFDL